MNSGIFLSFGTNLGDRAANLDAARELMEQETGKITAISSTYRTAPWGKSDQPDFYNQVVSLETNLSPALLLEKILLIEIYMGRVREVHWGPRIIDIDILLYNDVIIHEETLHLPHPGIPLRRFVLEPLNELAGDMIHPELGKDIRTLLEECPDTLAVERVL